MQDNSSIPSVTTTRKPLGAMVEWKWPDGSFWGSSLEFQHLGKDGLIHKQIIDWPVTGKLMDDLKENESCMCRLRPIVNGQVREWLASDWIDVAFPVSGEEVDKKDISSSITIGIELDTSHVQKALDEIEASVRNSELFSVRKGEVFIKDALITGTMPVAVKLPACNGKSPTASAILQDYKQHTLAGEIAPATYKASLGISCNDLAEETLSAVLGATLPGIPINRIEEAAITVARAVRSAFNALDKDNASPR